MTKMTNLIAKTMDFIANKTKFNCDNEGCFVSVRSLSKGDITHIIVKSYVVAKNNATDIVGYCKWSLVERKCVLSAHVQEKES